MANLQPRRRRWLQPSWKTLTVCRHCLLVVTATNPRSHTASPNTKGSPNCWAFGCLGRASRKGNFALSTATQLWHVQMCQVHSWDSGAATAKLGTTKAIALNKAKCTLCRDAGLLQASLCRTEEVVTIPAAHASLVFQPKPQWRLALLVSKWVSRCSIKPFGQDCCDYQGSGRFFGEHVTRQMQLVQSA